MPVAAEAVGAVGHQVFGVRRHLMPESVHRVAFAHAAHIDDGPDAQCQSDNGKADRYNGPCQRGQECGGVPGKVWGKAWAGIREYKQRAAPHQGGQQQHKQHRPVHQADIMQCADNADPFFVTHLAFYLPVLPVFLPSPVQRERVC